MNSPGLVDFFGLAEHKFVRVRPGTTDIAFLKAEVAWPDGRTVHSLWLHDAAGTRKIDADTAGSPPAWSSDGTRMAWVSNASDGSRSLRILDADRRADTAAGAVPPGRVRLHWLPDDRLLLWSAKPEAAISPAPPLREYAAMRIKTVAAILTPELPDHPTALEEPADGLIGEIAVHPASGRIAATCPASADIDGILANRRIVVWDSADSRPRTHTIDAFVEEHLVWSPDGDTIAAIGAMDPDGAMLANESVFLVDPKTGDTRRLLGEHDFQVQQIAWSPDGRALDMLVNAGVRNALMRVDLKTGTTETLFTADASIEHWQPAGDDRTHFFRLRSAECAGELFRRVGDAPPEALTGDNADYTAGREMPRQEAFRWSGPDGRQVEGLLFIPPESAGGGPRPCVVGLHGGPAESVRFGPGKDTDYATVLASRGFLVFRPNYRGSTGYGDEVYRDIIDRYFNHMPGDVLSGVDALVEQGLADPDRLAVMGYSAGGALTKKLVTMTDRFRAASAGAGASCWWTMYALGDLRVTRDHWFGGPPRFEDGDPGIWWDASPMRGVAKAKTPMLLFYGEEDRRNPWFEGALFHRALQDNGIECRLFLAPGQGHGDWKKSFHLAKANLEIEFFERLLNGREYDFEPAPGAGGADRQEGDRSP